MIHPISLDLVFANQWIGRARKRRAFGRIVRGFLPRWSR